MIMGAFKREPDWGTGQQDPRGTSPLPGRFMITRIAYGVLFVASLAFIVFCIQSAIGYDRNWDRSTEAQFHAPVTFVSLAFYGPMFVVLLIGLRERTRWRYWRYALWLGLLGCVGMAIWSLLLSYSISFDEVWPAWLTSGAYFAGLSIWGMRRGSRR